MKNFYKFITLVMLALCCWFVKELHDAKEQIQALKHFDACVCDPCSNNDSEPVEPKSPVYQLKPTGPATSRYYTAIDYIQAKDGLEGAQDFYRACEDPENFRRGAYFCDLAAIAAAIRYAENGGPGKEYGVLHPDVKPTYRSQAGWCAATVQKNWDRYLAGGECNNGDCTIKHKPGDSRDALVHGMQSYIYYLGHVYCPVGADNDPNGLNKYWPKNVFSHYNNVRNLAGERLLLLNK